MSDERVWIELPLSIDAAAAVMRGLASAWPESVAVTDHDRGPSWLCIELRGERVDDDI